MPTSRTLAAKTVRQLMAADGYLQLGLPAAALEELARVDDAGPLTSARDYLVGQALMADDRHEDALEPLQRAAESIPAPWNRAAYDSLTECFRATGRQELADVTEMWGEDDGIPPGFDPDAAVAVAADAAELAAESFETGETAWSAAEDFGDAGQFSADADGWGPTLWGGDGFGGELLSDAGQTGDFSRDAAAMEPGRPREWDGPSFDGGFGTDETDGDADLPRRSR